MIYIGRLGIKKEFEIRTRYEYGENLKDLAVIYKVPLRTLEERKAKSLRKGDPWIKGFRKCKGFKEFVEDNETKKVALNLQYTNRARQELDVLDKMIDKVYCTPHDIYDSETEHAFAVRSSRVEKTLKLRRNIEEIYTPEQKLQLELLKIMIDTKKSEAMLKSVELESKQIDLEFKRKELEALGNE
ncbi:hypothetical protein [Cetobacterium sp.]|uniref:hypothetical protein n=1 Tax=Cetobacterium sp. TaxID=2071632 RepID=UPI003EE80DF7